MNYVENFDLFGVEAKQIPCDKGSGAPTASTPGAVGCLYMDTDTGDIWKCVGGTPGTLEWENTSEDDAESDVTVDTTYVDEKIAQEKTERQQEIAVERARITNLASLEEGSTTGDAELMDIRVGYDGTVYESAGEAVRAQGEEFTEQQEQIADLGSVIYFNKKVKQDVTFVDYMTLYANEAYPNLFGKTFGSAGWSYIDYVSCVGAKAVNVLICDSGGNANHGFVFYDAEKNPINGYPFQTVAEGMKDATYPVPEGAAFFRTTVLIEHKPIFYAYLLSETNIKAELDEEVSRAKEAEAVIEAKVNALDTLADKKVLIIGDSISTENNSTGPNYGQYEKWVMKLVKQGFFSADKVTNDSIHATGFTVTAGETVNEAQLFINRLKAVANPGEYDLVIVFGGINDFIKCQTVNIEFSAFMAAVDEFFEYLTDTFVNARVCVFSPLRIHYNSTNLNGHIQQDYMEYIRNVAKSYCLPVLNLSEESGFYPWNEAFTDRWTFTGWTGGDGTQGDGVHPNEEWMEIRLVPMVKAFLKSLIV